MKLFAAVIALGIFFSICLAEDVKTTVTDSKVSIDAKGLDIRDIIHNIFNQAKADYVLDRSVNGLVYLSLHDSTLTHALDVLTTSANLKWEEKDGLYIINVKPKETAPIINVAVPKTSSKYEILLKIVTLNVNKSPLSEVLKSLSSQVNSPITADSEIPAYKVSMTIADKSLKYTLNALCHAAPITYKLDKDGVIRLHLKPIKTATLVSKKGIAAAEISSPNHNNLLCKSCHRSLSVGWKWCPWCGQYIEAAQK